MLISWHLFSPQPFMSPRDTLNHEKLGGATPTRTFRSRDAEITEKNAEKCGEFVPF
jgi:hypothetical protein